MIQLLKGVVGSTAYGLANEGSDVDRLGIHLLSTEDVLSVGFRQEKQSIVETDPDFTSHEIGKFFSLAVQGNPTVNEILWLDWYEVRNHLIEPILDERGRILGTNQVKDSYCGYAMSQASRLVRRHEAGKSGFDSKMRKRTRKHARHCGRLLIQARHLLQTGEIMIDVSYWSRLLEEYAAMAEDDPHRFRDVIYDEVKLVDRLENSVLLDEPDRDWVNKRLLDIRKMGWRNLGV